MTMVLALAVGLAATGALLLLRSRDPRSHAGAVSPASPVIAAPHPNAQPAANVEPQRATRRSLTEADRDAPTPLPTLAALDPRVTDPESRVAGEKARELTLLAIQIHGLDRVQESLGDVARARAVLEVAHAIRGTLRAGDTCARLDREGLLALLPGIDGSTAPSIAARVRHAVSSLMLVTHAGQEIQLGVLIGRASSPGEGASFPELLGAARRDLERVKDRLVPVSEIDRAPAERIRHAVPWVPN